MISNKPEPLRIKSIQRKDGGPIVVTAVSADGKSVTTTNIQPLPSRIRKAFSSKTVEDENE